MGGRYVASVWATVGVILACMTFSHNQFGPCLHFCAQRYAEEVTGNPSTGSHPRRIMQHTSRA